MPVFRPKPYTIWHEDCLLTADRLGPESVDAIVTDPPYHLTQNSRKGSPRKNDPKTPFGRTRLGSSGFMGKTWDGGDISFDPATWATFLEVVKPGTHLLAFGGARTFHRLALAIEEAGWEIRDCLMWVYGSSMPKGCNISKAVDKMAGAKREVIGVAGKSGSARSCMAGDFTGGEYMATSPAADAAKQWDGWNTQLKPSYEPIILARAPFRGTIASNVLKNGTGALNIDGCRVSMSRADAEFIHKAARPNSAGQAHRGAVMNRPLTPTVNVNPLGRYPANLIHDGSNEVVTQFPKQSGGKDKRGKCKGTRPGGFGNVGAETGDGKPCATVYSDEGSAARFFQACPINDEDLELSRLIYCSKASKKDRGAGNNHPTVKPTSLLRYLVRLVCPPNGLIWDPFMGSGTTGKAAMLEGFRFVGSENDTEFDYVEIAARRIEAAYQERLKGGK